MIFVPIRMMTPREMEELRLSTTSVTRHDFLVVEERSAVFTRLVPELASAIAVPGETLVQSAPEWVRVAGRTGLTETLVEARVSPAGADGDRSAVQVVAQSRDRVSPTLAIFVLSFVGMAVGFFGSFAAHIPPAFGGLVTCAVPFFLAMAYMAYRKRSVESSSKTFYMAFHGLEATLAGAANAKPKATDDRSS